MARGRILVLTCHLPFPPLSGGRRRELELIRRLAGSFDIRLMVVSKTIAEDRANVARLERFCASVEVFPATPTREQGRASDPPQVLRHRSADLTCRVREVLARGEADLVHVEGFYLMQHVAPDPGVPVLLVEQNIEYELERQRASAAGDGGAWRAAVAMRAEVAAWRRADLLGVLTDEDAASLRATLPTAAVRFLPDGADHVPPPGPRDAAVERPDAPLVALVGNFSYAPNADAAVHLCRDVLPRLRRAVPDVHVWLVGNAPPPEVAGLAGDRIRVTGRVDDVLPYVDAADVVVCPLRVGGGIKVKAIEAMRRGKAIVSSSIGAQGLPDAARRAIAVADGPDRTAGAIADLLLDPARRNGAERRAAAAATALPSWDTAADALAAAYGELLAARVPAGEGVPSTARAASVADG